MKPTLLALLLTLPAFGQHPQAGSLAATPAKLSRAPVVLRDAGFIAAGLFDSYTTRRVLSLPGTYETDPCIRPYGRGPMLWPALTFDEWSTMILDWRLEGFIDRKLQGHAIHRFINRRTLHAGALIVETGFAARHVQLGVANERLYGRIHR